MIYSIAIAVCVFSIDVRECNQVSARHWIVAPEQAASVSGCMARGMQYAANARVVPTGSYAKIFCRAGGWPRERTT
jgi:hypothetical protein